MASEIETLEEKKQENVPDVEVKGKEESQQEEEEEDTKENEASDGEDEAEENKGSSKRGRKDSAKKGNSGSKKVKTGSSRKEPVTPVDRPTRERKTVERYTESMQRLSSPKPFSVEKGSGTQLKDIPNGTSSDPEHTHTVFNQSVRVVLMASEHTRTRYTDSYRKAINSGSKDAALQILREEQPWHYLLHLKKLNANLDRIFPPPPTIYVSRYTMSSFNNLPNIMKHWVDDYFEWSNGACPSRPKSIIIESWSRMGKTEWARSLGKHNYLAGYFDLNPQFYSNEAEYNIIDNITPKCLKKWKELIGAKKDWQSGYKYGRRRHIKGGIPAIVLCNPDVGSSYSEYLNKAGNEELKSWTLQNAVFVHLTEPLFSI